MLRTAVRPFRHPHPPRATRLSTPSRPRPQLPLPLPVTLAVRALSTCSPARRGPGGDAPPMLGRAPTQPPPPPETGRRLKAAAGAGAEPRAATAHAPRRKDLLTLTGIVSEPEPASPPARPSSSSSAPEAEDPSALSTPPAPAPDPAQDPDPEPLWRAILARLRAFQKLRTAPSSSPSHGNGIGNGNGAGPGGSRSPLVDGSLTALAGTPPSFLPPSSFPR
ncbi:hypothetical protein CALCODRAFT_501475 [Calocera cornea HHB12733]|uniref:Uncharacterized protein n=1 Tax=Calocera cornea HHB12733 TaxID=1353952 RepID=A0A165DLF0_9BASI|nr:hypothetical protein CALCODRAFT_501475 [Calocera cornea HHB12733]